MEFSIGDTVEFTFEHREHYGKQAKLFRVIPVPVRGVVKSIGNKLVGIEVKTPSGLETRQIAKERVKRESSS